MTDSKMPEPVATTRDVVRAVWGLCEALEDEAYDKLKGDLTDHEKGFWSAQKMTAKMIRRATGMPALRASTAQPVGVSVKPLEWDHGHEFAGQPCSYAETEFGAWMMVAFEGRGGRWAYDDGNGETSVDDWQAREECEAAAQADYERRIHAALSLPAQGGEGGASCSAS